jgi:hypothetical protein
MNGSSGTPISVAAHGFLREIDNLRVSLSPRLKRECMDPSFALPEKI